MPSFTIVGYVWKILGRGGFLSPPYPWAAPKKPILNKVIPNLLQTDCTTETSFYDKSNGLFLGKENFVQRLILSNTIFFYFQKFQRILIVQFSFNIGKKPLFHKKIEAKIFFSEDDMSANSF